MKKVVKARDRTEREKDIVINGRRAGIRDLKEVNKFLFETLEYERWVKAAWRARGNSSNVR